jgi:transcriptional regulator with XRE-family HTH domain
LARPSFKLDTSRLRSLREDSSLTQREVAQQANIILKKFDKIAGKNKLKSNEDLLDSYERSYQRIEQKGNTSKKIADALAQVFKTTVKILQGGAPEAEDYSSVVARIEQQLREQKKLGSNLALQHALTQHVKTYDNPIEEDDCIREFSINISKQIEIAQIGQNSSEIARLVELTGWSEAQLQKQGIDGHWLLLAKIHVSPETKIVLGIFD